MVQQPLDVKDLKIMRLSMIASVSELCLTYPLEYIKTVEQLAPRFPMKVVEETPSKLQGPKLGRNKALEAPKRVLTYASKPNQFPELGNIGLHWYSGLTAMTIGSLIKTGVRFTVYNQMLKQELQMDQAANILFASMLAGCAESLTLIPFENMKVAAIERAAFKDGKVSVLDEIKQGGATRLLQGWSPTLLRQIANSGVRFTAFNAIMQLSEGNVPESWASAAGVLLSSAAVIALTQPIDVVKTRMQVHDAPALYNRNSLKAMYRVFLTSDKPLKVMWAGWLPRYFRVTLQGVLTAQIFRIFGS
ncbi:hypothetical protein CANCADRAFT_4134 [Tortispora caseinolytica NRRL Y-17796]|uniref:Uncharacterized protein n=1 Tax=Tortispora caseinolytica NRRL Y-17796 TaxID=767744 RepID=A0A1E4TCZ6_9ASCO|nr:hypothetical protein CANCADRAFT_4134 [Tortispora caseinolytica NRRL Y-17796]